MPEPPPGLRLRRVEGGAELDSLEPVWDALQEHHAAMAPELAPGTPKRDNADAWRMRRLKYERWVGDPDTFMVLAELEGRLVGYAFVTVGPGYASWATGERLADLETLSVVPDLRDAGIGGALVEAVWGRLAEIGVTDLAVTTNEANEGARRFYERSGFYPAFVTYHAKRRR